MDGQRTRRHFLTMVGCGAAFGTAGCLGRVAEAVTSVTYPDPGAPTYREWLPAPTAVSAFDDRYRVFYLRFEDILRDGPLGEVGIDRRNFYARNAREPLGIDPRRITETVSFDLQTTLLVGTFETARLTNAVGTLPYDYRETHRGFEVYTHRERDRTVALRDDAVVQSFAARSGEVVRAVIGAKAGGVPRYHEVDVAVDELLTAVGAPTAAIIPGIGSTDIEPAVAAAEGQQLTSETAYLQRAVVYPDTEMATPGRVRDTYGTRSVSFDGFRPRDITVDGQVGQLVTSRALSEVLDTAVTELIPLVSWTFDYHPDESTLDITHRAGDPVSVERLTLDVSDDVMTDIPGVDTSTISAGDSFAVTADPEDTVRLSWTHHNGAQTLFRYEVSSS